MQNELDNTVDSEQLDDKERAQGTDGEHQEYDATVTGAIEDTQIGIRDEALESLRGDRWMKLKVRELSLKYTVTPALANALITLMQDGVISQDAEVELEELGKGAFGRVDRVIFTQDAKNIEGEVATTRLAIKTIMEGKVPGSTLEEEGMRQFIGNGIALGWGEDFLVMQSVDGVSGERVIHEAREQDDGMKLATAWEMAQAVKEFHLSGHAHRDVKPANFVFDQYGDAHLIDCGLSRPFERPDEEWKGVDTISGSPPYISPEQVAFAFGRKKQKEDYLSPKDDVWSLGCAAFEIFSQHEQTLLRYLLLPNEKPTAMDCISMLQQITDADVNEMLEDFIILEDKKVEKKVRSLLCKMLRVNPKKRCTLSEAIQSLEDLLAGEERRVRKQQKAGILAQFMQKVGLLTGVRSKRGKKSVVGIAA